MMSHQTVIVLDFGGQYNQLIARRVRECGVYCEVKPYTTPLEQLRAMEPIGFIFTGGPNSVYEAGAPKADPAIFELGVPVLGICYGCQFMAHALGGQVTEAHEDTAREYGKTETYYDTACKLFKGLPEQGHLLDEPRGLDGQRCPRASPSPPTLTPAPTWPLPTRSGASTGCSTTWRSITPSTAWT